LPTDIRRIVTGHDAQGRSNITFQGPAPNFIDMAGWPGARITDIWVTEETPADNDGLVDRGARPIQHDPAPSGTIFRVVEIPPEPGAELALDMTALAAQIGSQNVSDENDRAKHPTMHVTDSIDYLMVMSGELIMLMEDGEVLLRPGDCIVQRGTKHAWVNRSGKPCVMAAILVDAKRAARA